ncbi:MAG TPA: tetratricopeptide repeat protein [Candidatus Omnitrophota bacterium]|nr:tetratricopeptide repeat protein [Candidatus Omnitrophota bacterium]HPD84879.1 tetratricopeptide repeat protein [Candidatus Omnitrophota bacterium]HRZ03737.1 tetratricopeptide repeat protein [Candidatus Omnitrophota bacterium]
MRQRLEVKDLTGRIISLSRRVGVLYLIAFLCTASIISKRNFRADRLDYLKPPLVKLVKISQGQESARPEILEPYIEFYEKVNEYAGSGADILAVLGFCCYYYGDEEKAISFYEKAVVLDPGCLWPQYNLGVIYFKKGFYSKAADSLEQALSIPPDVTAKSLYASFIYWQLMKEAKVLDGSIAVGIKEGYEGCYRLLMLSYQKLQDYQKMLNLALYATKSVPDSKDFFYYYAGFAAYQLKEYRQAVYFLLESLRINPRQADVLQYLGLSYGELGEKRDSEDALARALGLRRSNPQESPAQTEKNINVRLF